MKPETRYKQPYDSEIFEIDCSKRLPTGVTISAVAAAIFDENGTDVSSSMIQGTPSISGSNVYVQVKNGTDGKKYNLRIRLTLDNGEYAEDDITVIIRERSLG